MKTTFGSDNFSAVDQAVMDFLQKINGQGHAQSYDGDKITNQARKEFENVFGPDIDVMFVSTGTAANILSLKLLLEKPYDAVVTSAVSHIYEEETGALAANSTAQIFPLKHTHGKISIEDLAQDVKMRRALEEHSANPKVLSVANPTEMGTVYTTEELKSLADFCHENDMFLHIDGARLSNAAVMLEKSLKEISRDVGADILSFGGAKNGLMNAEAVVIFNAPKSSLLHMQKQVMQLNSKARYISGQFIPYLRDELWFKNAKRANELAASVAQSLESVGVEFTQPFQTNQIFCKLSPESREKLRATGHQFYDWNSLDEVRLVTAWDSSEEDIKVFMDTLKDLRKNEEARL